MIFCLKAECGTIIFISWRTKHFTLHPECGISFQLLKNCEYHIITSEAEKPHIIYEKSNP